MKNPTLPPVEKLGPVIIKKCHCCGHIIESQSEPIKCPQCAKYFLPLNYLVRVKADRSTDFYDLFSSSEQLSDEDLIKGLYALW
jgi:hypothetical protein